MIKAFINHLVNYFNFKGRTSKKEFWKVILAYFILSFIIYVIVFNFPSLVVIDYIFALVTVIPSLSLFVRRFHDSNHSGFWLLSFVIPPLGLIISFYLGLLNSNDENNKYSN